MYIKVRRDKLRDKARSVSLRFEIIESYRDTVTGNPRNRLVLYVGSIKEDFIFKPIAQERFWRIADTKITRLNLPPDEEQQVRDKLLAQVPRPKSWSEIVESVIIKL